MGVPALFLWLIKRCPQLVRAAVHRERPSNDGPERSDASPEIDNLYLDMNGIIHPCCHHVAKGLKDPKTEADMFNNLFVYLDKVIAIVNPQKLIYFAVGTLIFC